MILKMTNQDKDFYQYMGKIFGSRDIEKKLNDRIYDDDSKEWYIYLDEEEVMAFVSISNNIIKNIYAVEEKYLEEILGKIKNENNITYSVVPNTYEEIYEKIGFKIYRDENYKNFITIYIDEGLSKTKLNSKKSTKSKTKTSKRSLTKSKTKTSKKGRAKVRQKQVKKFS